MQYTNAKVLLVGDSGAGKTGLSRRIATGRWRASDSTVGAWSTQWNLPVDGEAGIEREIWLWDFGGQADQRLIHQLYMEEAALAVLVFDGQRDNLLDSLEQWHGDLERATQRTAAKLLVLGRADAGPLRISRSSVEAFALQHGYGAYLETSAKTGLGCDDLRAAIANAIDWSRIPWRSSPALFRSLRDGIVQLKDEGRVLVRFAELAEILQHRMPDAEFHDAELRTVVRLLAGPGVLWELTFGDWVLLQPERINAYAQAVIRTMREDGDERGCILEERVLNGDLLFSDSARRLDRPEERLILLAMHESLLERRLCVRVHTGEGPMLIFPSYYRRERPQLSGHPAVLVSYIFEGGLDEIYTTLVVRLHHTEPFEQDELWRYAADFRTLTGRQLGIKLTRLPDGRGRLDTYFEPQVSIEEKLIFSKYVHEHLRESGTEVQRLRHYICPHCGTPVGNPEAARRKLDQGKEDLPCIECDNDTKRIPLWDELEERFGSAEMRKRVRDLRRQSTLVLDNESRERILVGELITTAADAGQISREVTVSDHGIDMEIEFKDDHGHATGKKLYLQLKSGDSHLRTRKSDGAEIFDIQKPRHAEYWRQQAFPVMLVVRTSDGNIRWMEIKEHLRRASSPGRQIQFDGEELTPGSILRWRDRALAT